MIFILNLLFIGLVLKIYRIKKAISKCQTKLYIHFECPTFSLKKHLIDLTYASNYYKISIKNRMLTTKNFFFFGCIQLNDCIGITNKLTKINEPVSDKIYVFSLEIRQTVRMMANEFHPLLIIADRNDKHLDVFHLTDLLTGTQIKGKELYPLSALTDMNRLVP